MARRLQELYAARDLARSELDRERARGARDAQSAAQWTSLLGTGIDAASKGIGAVQGYRDASTARDLESALARNASEVGRLAEDRQGAALPSLYGSNLAPDVEGPRGPDEIGADVEGPRGPADEPTRYAVVRGQSEDPYAAQRYTETPQQAAARLVREDPALADRQGFDALFGGDRAEARRRAEAQLAKDITGRRAGIDALKRDTAKTADERRFKLTDLALKERGQTAEQGRFEAGQEFKAKESAADRELRERLAREGNVAAEKRAGIMAAGMRERQAQVPTSETEALSGFEAAKRMAVQQVAALGALNEAGVGTGMGAPTLNTVGQALGIDNPEYTAWRGNNQAIISEARKAMTGLGVSIPEIAETNQYMPNESDAKNPQRYAAKMDAYLNRVQQKINARLDVLEAQGKDVSKLRSVVGGGGPSGKPSADVRARQLLDEMEGNVEAVERRMLEERYSP